MTVIHAFKPEPLVLVGKQERMVDPASLTEHQKQLLWLGIKTIDPMLAELLKTDANIEDLKQQFNAAVVFTIDDFNRFIQAGQRSIEERKQCTNYSTN